MHKKKQKKVAVFHGFKALWYNVLTFLADQKQPTLISISKKNCVDIFENTFLY